MSWTRLRWKDEPGIGALREQIVVLTTERDLARKLAHEAVAKMDGIKAELTQLRSQQRWVPVGERLPERGIYVLVSQNGEVVTDRIGDDGKWEDADWATTHWQPLPSPPTDGASSSPYRAEVAAQDIASWTSH
jgi:hypothetical protein